MADRAQQIRAGIKAALASTYGSGYQVSEYLLGNPTGPGFEVDLDPEGVNFDQSMGRGLDEWWFLVRGFVAQTTDVGSQQLRDKFLNPSGELSLKAALEADRTLGGACQACRVVRAVPRTFGRAAGEGSVTYTGAEWRVRIMASG
jgi:hypothetical protein